MENTIQTAYSDPKTGFVSAPKLYRKLKQDNKDITLDAVQNALNKAPDYQIMKEDRKPKRFNTIAAHTALACVQIDIIVYDRFKTKTGFENILCVIDVFSRYAACRPLKTRKPTEVLKAMKTIFNDDLKGIPENINCDNEFQAKQYVKWMTDNHIIAHFSDPEEINKNSIVERFNRTIALKLQRWRLSSGDSDWTKVLQDLVSSYNNDYHRTIKATPSDVFNNRDTNRQTVTQIERIYNIGDHVRVARKLKTFTKGDEVKYSMAVYIIDAYDGKKYVLKNLKSGEVLKKHYKQYELKKVGEIIEKDNTENSVKKIDVTKKKRQIKRKLNKEGIDSDNIIHGMKLR